MTETSTVNADQVCQANQDCYYSIVGQICLNNICTFSCLNDLDCPEGGKCIGEKCDWSGEPVPPLIPNSTQNNLDTTNSSEKPTDSKLSSPFIIAIVIVVALVVIFCLAAVLFLILRRRKLAESARGLKPLQLGSSRTSFGKSKRDLREKERERSSKKFQHDDDLIGPEDEGKDDEDLFTPAAVGTHRPPQRSQTMYGTSTPSTVELNVDYLVPGQHHFMQQEHYVEMERDDQQQQQQQQQEQQE